jgi:hypothetical protein
MRAYLSPSNFERAIASSLGLVGSDIADGVDGGSNAGELDVSWSYNNIKIPSKVQNDSHHTRSMVSENSLSAKVFILSGF